MGKSNKRRNFDGKFKAKIAIEALKEKKTLTEIASEFELNVNQVSEWKKEFLANSGSVFENSKAKKADKTEDVTALYEQIGRLQMDIAFLKKKL